MNIKNRIIFDLSQARPHRYVGYHGGGVYAYKFFLGLLKELESNGQLPRLIVTFDKSRKLDSQVKDILKDKRIHNVYVESIEDIISTIFAYNSSDSTVILPMPYKILAKLEKKPESKLIATIHGLRELQFKKERYLSWYKFPNIVKMLFWWINSFFKENTTSKMFEYLKINDQILTDSHFSKKQINKFLDRNSKLLKQNIKVIYPPISDKYKFNNISKKIDYPYFLSVSASRPVKNCIRVLDAINYYNLFKAFPDWKYVLTGVNKNLRNLIKYRYKKLYPNLVLFDYITTEKLHELYSQSSFSVFPSLDEGFGYPIMESYVYGKPIACSNTTSLPEIASDGADYFNPTNKKEIFNSLKALIGDEQYRDKLSKNALSQYSIIKKESDIKWEQLFNQILNSN